MSPRLRPLAAGLVVSAAALLGTAPTALAAPSTDCVNAPEDTTVQVYARTATPVGPTGTTSELQCGNRYYGYRRIETEWADVPDWRSAADAAITRALTSGDAPIYSERSDTWAVHAPGVVVVLGPRGLIVDAAPAAA